MPSPPLTRRNRQILAPFFLPALASVLMGQKRAAHGDAAETRRAQRVLTRRARKRLRRHGNACKSMQASHGKEIEIYMPPEAMAIE